MFKGSGQQLGHHGLLPHLSPHLCSPGARAGPREMREQEGSLSTGPSPDEERGHLSWVAAFPLKSKPPAPHTTSRPRAQCSGHFHQQRKELGFDLDAPSAACHPSFPRKYSLTGVGCTFSGSNLAVLKENHLLDDFCCEIGFL